MDNLNSLLILGIVFAAVIFIYKKIEKLSLPKEKDVLPKQEGLMDWLDDVEEVDNATSMSIEAKKLEYESRFSKNMLVSVVNEGDNAMDYDFDGDLTNSNNNGSSDNLLSDFDLRKAVLYSEVLKRNY